jgi:hypothetical protein
LKKKIRISNINEICESLLSLFVITINLVGLLFQVIFFVKFLMLLFTLRTSLALMVYRETIGAGEKPTSQILSQVLGCLKFPYDTYVKNRLVENLGVTAESSKTSNLCSLIDGFGEYDPRAFSILEVSMEYGTETNYINFIVSFCC